MRRRVAALMIAVGILTESFSGPAQTAAPAKPNPDPATSTSVIAKPPIDPKSLAGQTETLLTLAIELKTQVDKTNKNILSMTVVKKASEIEQLAHQMKLQGKK